MQTFVDKSNALASILVAAAIYFSWAGEAGITIWFIPVVLLYFVRASLVQSLHHTQNVVLLLAFLLFVIVFFYHVMFDLIEVKAYLETVDENRKFVVKAGTSLIYALLLGALAALTIRAPIAAPAKLKYSLSQNQETMLFAIAWFPLILNGCIYFIAFSGRDYVELHSGGGAEHFLLKSLYLTFGSVLNLCICTRPTASVKRRFIWLTVGFVVVYGLLFKLRSPLLYYCLLLVYFYGRFASNRKILLWSGCAILFLMSVALVRDETLAEDGGGFALLNMLFNLGDFADTLNFARDYLDQHGSLLGGGIVGGVLGFGEPLANEYARIVAPDYFESGGGFGFFMLSEVAINFGFFGGGAVLVLFGYVLIRANRYRGSYLVTILLAATFANLFAVVRNDIGTSFRGVIYTVFSALFVLALINTFRRIPATMHPNRSTKFPF